MILPRFRFNASKMHGFEAEVQWREPVGQTPSENFKLLHSFFQWGEHGGPTAREESCTVGFQRPFGKVGALFLSR